MITTNKPPTMKHGASDDFQTPDYALRPLLPYLNKDWFIWEPAAGNDNLVLAFEYLGYSVLGTDIKSGTNFLTDSLPITPPKNVCIVTNPPYSLKNEFFQKCMDSFFPYALLLPLTTFGTYDRQAMLKEAGTSVIFMGGRVNFEVPAGMNDSGSWQETAWFIGNFPNIAPNTLIYPEAKIDRAPIVPVGWTGE